MTIKINSLIQKMQFFAVKGKNLVIDSSFDCNTTLKD